MRLGLAGKVALVTGASKGIGLAVAEALAAEGARVVISARCQPALDRAAAAIREHGGEVLGVPADVTRPEDVERLVAAAVSRFGTIHVLVNNAGGIGSFSPFDELSDGAWLGVLELNVLSAVRVTRAVLPHMRRQEWGRIINMGSESGVQPDALMPHYNASKAALINLTKSLSKAYAADGCRGGVGWRGGWAVTLPSTSIGTASELAVARVESVARTCTV
jgi:NAD(P)-dependent dehydrogenase (short-subunit alcohol dehydrogenase family)